MLPRPCSPATAAARALIWLDDSSIVYWLGAGDYHPIGDVPYTAGPGGKRAADCRYATNYCYELPSHRPGFNHGAWASVSDDVNYNSAIEDSEHARELFVPVTDSPQLGDIVCYPTIRIIGADGHLHEFIGHGGIVVGISRAAAFDISIPKYQLLDVVHCHGPAGIGPAITRTDGSIWDHHSIIWPKPEHHSKLLRLVP